MLAVCAAAACAKAWKASRPSRVRFLKGASFVPHREKPCPECFGNDMLEEGPSGPGNVPLYCRRCEAWFPG